MGAEVRDETNVDLSATVATAITVHLLQTQPNLTSLKFHVRRNLEIIGDTSKLFNSDPEKFVARLKTLEIRAHKYKSKPDPYLNAFMRIVKKSALSAVSFHCGSFHDSARLLEMPELTSIKYGIDRQPDELLQNHAEHIKKAIFTTISPVDYGNSDAVQTILENLKSFPNMVHLTLCPIYCAMELDTLLITRIARLLPRLKLLMEIREKEADTWKVDGSRYVLSVEQSRTRVWEISRNDGEIQIAAGNASDYNFKKEVQGCYLTSRDHFVKIPNESWT